MRCWPPAVRHLVLGANRSVGSGAARPRGPGRRRPGASCLLMLCAISVPSLPTRLLSVHRIWGVCRPGVPAATARTTIRRAEMVRRDDVRAQHRRVATHLVMYKLSDYGPGIGLARPRIRRLLLAPDRDGVPRRWRDSRRRDGDMRPTTQVGGRVPNPPAATPRFWITRSKNEGPSSNCGLLSNSGVCARARAR